VEKTPCLLKLRGDRGEDWDERRVNNKTDAKKKKGSLASTGIEQKELCSSNKPGAGLQLRRLAE
jgi:hypothetical protein